MRASENQRSAVVASVVRLSVATRGRCGRWHAELSGEVDLANVGRLAVALKRMRGDGRRALVLDVSGLTFIGAAGLGVLVRAARASEAAGGALTLARPSAMMTRILTATGLDDVLIDRPPSTCDLLDLGGGRPASPSAGASGSVRFADRRSTDMRQRDEERIANVLAGMVFPAMKWQLLTEAVYYGADQRSQVELAGLSEGQYRDLGAVQRSLSRVRAERAAAVRREIEH